MEDEEYVPENSELRFYLESLNLFEASKENVVKQKTCNVPVAKEAKSKFSSPANCIDKDVIEQIEELLSGRMLFEEDVNNIEKLLSNFKVIKIGMLRSIFENVSGFIVIVLGLCVYWIMGSYVFFMISVYYAYNAADYLWRKHFNQRRLKNLTAILQANYDLFKKTLKFIKDSDKILKYEIQSKSVYPKGFSGGYELYLNLKEEFAAAENEIIKILTTATQKLIAKLPFYDYVENPEFYLCNKYEEQFLKAIDISKLYQIYLLVQSEFLQRLALSLVPNLQKSGKGDQIELNKIVRETSILLKKLESKFNQKFKFVFLSGIYDSDQKFSLNVQRTLNQNSRNLYRNEFIINIQDMSNAFQRLLIRSRTLENNFSHENNTKEMENELTNIRSELEMCQRNVNDSFIVLKKFSKPKDIKIERSGFSDGMVQEDDSDETKPRIDLSMEGEPIKDEIFEAYMSGEIKDEFQEEFDVEDVMKKRLEREYSKLVLNELKNKISEKAKDWEAREANAVKKIFGVDKEVEHLIASHESKEIDKDCEVSIAPVHNCHAYIREEACDEKSDSDLEESGISGYTTQSPNSEFLRSITEARRQLLTRPTVEEHFCASGEDSDKDFE